MYVVFHLCPGSDPGQVVGDSSSKWTEVEDLTNFIEDECGLVSAILYVVCVCVCVCVFVCVCVCVCACVCVCVC